MKEKSSINTLQTSEIIRVAEECGLVHLTKEHPVNFPAQQRLISRLQNFAEKVILEAKKDKKEEHQ